MSTNIENCEKYIKKQSLLGTETFKFEIKPETDEVLLKKYIENGDEFRVIEIPKFVTGISRKVDSLGFIKDWNTPFNRVKQNLKIINNSKITDMSYMFFNYYGNKIDLSEFDTTGVTNMKKMFSNCGKVREFDLRNFDTSEVKDMQEMFSRCLDAENIDLSSFSTHRVTNMRRMFFNCTDIKELDVSSLNTESVTDMSEMFASCFELQKLDLRNFDTSNADTLEEMFTFCTSLTDLDISSFKIKYKIVLLFDMFKNCNKLVKIKVNDERIIVEQAVSFRVERTG